MTDIKSEARRDRLKSALRENLKRRKAQERGRTEAATRETGCGTDERPERKSGE